MLVLGGSNYSKLWFEWQKLTIFLRLSGFTSSMDELVRRKSELTGVSGLPFGQQNPFAFLVANNDKTIVQPHSSPLIACGDMKTTNGAKEHHVDRLTLLVSLVAD